MTRKQRPAWDKGWGGPYSFQYLSDKDLKNLSEALDVAKIGRKTRVLMEEMVRDFASNKHCAETKPRLAQVKPALEVVRDRAKSFFESLERLDSVSSWELSIRLGEDLSALPNAETNAQKIYGAAKNALKELEKDKGGRPRTKVPLRTLILDLKNVFEEKTGKKAALTWNPHKEKYEGHFYNVVSAFLEIVDPGEIWSNSSLGQQIKQALKLSRDTPDL